MSTSLSLKPEINRRRNGIVIGKTDEFIIVTHDVIWSDACDVIYIDVPFLSNWNVASLSGHVLNHFFIDVLASIHRLFWEEWSGRKLHLEEGDLEPVGVQQQRLWRKNKLCFSGKLQRWNLCGEFHTPYKEWASGYWFSAMKVTKKWNVMPQIWLLVSGFVIIHYYCYFSIFFSPALHSRARLPACGRRPRDGNKGR